MRESRQSVRHAISLMVMCERTGKKPDKARTVNISSSGVMLNRLFSQNTQLKVAFSLPTLRDPLYLKGKIIRDSSDGSAMSFNDDNDTQRSRNIISDYVRQSCQPDNAKKEGSFFEVLKNHKEEDESTIREIFYYASKLLLFRSELTKKTLKRKEVCQAIEIVRSHLDKGYCFESAPLLSAELSHAQAIEYYDKSVQGTLKDIHGREVLVDEEGLEFLFKDPITEKHDPDMKPQNYQPPRGRRLPWIKSIISKTTEIYERFELSRNENIYYYVARAIIKTRTKSVQNYFLIVTYKKKGMPITFKTAYFMGCREDLFRAICQSKVFNPIYLKNDVTSSS